MHELEQISLLLTFLYFNHVVIALVIYAAYFVTVLLIFLEGLITV